MCEISLFPFRHYIDENCASLFPEVHSAVYNAGELSVYVQSPDGSSYSPVLTNSITFVSSSGSCAVYNASNSFAGASVIQPMVSSGTLMCGTLNFYNGGPWSVSGTQNDNKFLMPATISIPNNYGAGGFISLVDYYGDSDGTVSSSQNYELSKTEANEYLALQASYSANALSVILPNGVSYLAYLTTAKDGITLQCPENYGIAGYTCNSNIANMIEIYS